MWQGRHIPQAHYRWRFHLRDEERMSYAARCQERLIATAWCRETFGSEYAEFARWQPYEFVIYFLDDHAALAFKMRWG